MTSDPILFFGSSHCSAIIAAARTYFPQHAIIGAPLQRAPYWECVDGPFYTYQNGRLTLNDSQTRQRFAQMMRGAGLPPDLMAFDGPMFLAFGVHSNSIICNTPWLELWRTHSLLPSRRRAFLSRAAFKEILRHQRRDLLAFAATMTAHGKRIAFIPNPPPRPPETLAQRSLRRARGLRTPPRSTPPSWMERREAAVLHRTTVDLMTELYAEQGAGMVDIGDGGCTPEGYLRSDLQADAMHATAAFGRLVVARCLSMLQNGG